MPELKGQTPEGYDASDASALEKGIVSDAEGKAFYEMLPSSNYYEQYNPVQYDEIEGTPEDPAALTDIPTSSTNVRRPRTVAAGYDPARQVLTVMFRDGTLFNYYNVTPGEWRTFQNSYSKGPLLNLWNKGQYNPGFLLQAPHSYGPADVSNVSSKVLSTIYQVARSSQFRYASNKGTVYRTAQGKGYSLPKSKKGKPPKNTPPAAKAHRPHKP